MKSLDRDYIVLNSNTKMSSKHRHRLSVASSTSVDSKGLRGSLGPLQTISVQSTKKDFLRKIEGICSNLTSACGSSHTPGSPAHRPPVRPQTPLINQYPSMASIGAPSSRKSLKKSSRSSQQRVSQMRDKVADIEQSLNALKENVSKTHNQSVASEKNVAKAVKTTQKEFTGQVEGVKEAVTRLSEVMAEEFEAVRQEYSSQLEATCRPLFQRLQQLELHAASQIQEISEEGAVNRKGLEQRFQEVRTLVEDEFRRDLDRQKTMLQSLMAD